MTTDTHHIESDITSEIAYEDHLTTGEPIERRVLPYVPHNIQAVGRFDDTYVEVHLETAEQREFGTTEGLNSETPRFGVVDRVTTLLVEAERLDGDPLSGTLIESFAETGERITVDWTYGQEPETNEIRYAVSIDGRWFRLYDYLGLADVIRCALIDEPVERRVRTAIAVEKAYWAFMARKSGDWSQSDILSAYDRATIVYQAKADG